MKQSLSFLPKTWESRELRRMERMLWERDKDVLGPRHVAKPCFLRDAPFFWSLWTRNRVGCRTSESFDIGLKSWKAVSCTSTSRCGACKPLERRPPRRRGRFGAQKKWREATKGL